ncbi:MAG: hypothetical protein HRF43_07815 [Phycisphaerae bacterium]|jgi:hypothetical protein
MAARLAGEKVTLRVRREGDEHEVTLVLAVPEDIGEVPDGESEGPSSRPAQTRPESD